MELASVTWRMTMVLKLLPVTTDNPLSAFILVKEFTTCGFGTGRQDGSLEERAECALHRRCCRH